LAGRTGIAFRREAIFHFDGRGRAKNFSAVAESMCMMSKGFDLCEDALSVVREDYESRSK